MECHHLCSLLDVTHSHFLLICTLNLEACCLHLVNFPDELGNKWKDVGRRALGGGVEVADEFRGSDRKTKQLQALPSSAEGSRSMSST